uniref:Uncharacterized protein n=1 Tax=Arundo donax TaxID=35708 RepID=A0A0A9EBL4_ARUDO
MVMHALLFCLGTMERIKRERGLRRLDSDCSTAPTCDGRHDFIWTRIWAFKYSMESLSSIISNGSSLMSISYWSRPQSSN